MSRVLAFDLGASSGRAVLAEYAEEKIKYKEIHRFENMPVSENGTLRWDFDYLMREIKKGIDLAIDLGGVDSMAFDTWGVDYGLLDNSGKLISQPFHYRDKRTERLPQQIFKQMPPEELYSATGIQIMPINTLFQLAAEKHKNISKFLFIPDLIVYELCGAVSAEQTIASTSQMLDPKTKNWNPQVVSLTGMPQHILPPVVKSATPAGEYKGIQIIKAAGHDTQCAVCAMPSAQQESAAFLSCGTWSLIGCECDAPVMTKKSMEDELSNELGANGKINYLKNISGLWLIQQLKKDFQAQGKTYSYSDMENLAKESKPFLCFIDADDPAFSLPGGMPHKIISRCREMGQAVPQSDGQIIRTVYESLAMKYRFALLQIEDNISRRLEKLYLLGGGSKDPLLCKMAACSTGIPVAAGPAEATALGNILLQLVALGDINNIESGRKIIRQSEKISIYEPENTDLWEKQYNRYLKLLNK